MRVLRMQVVNENRIRIKAGWFTVHPKDENHEYYGLIFYTEDHKQDVIIEIEDLTKLHAEIGKWVHKDGGS